MTVMFMGTGNDLKESRSDKLTAHSDEQRQENIAKYGEKEWDTISDAYRLSKEAGDIYCAFTAKKYITRYVGKNKKAGNRLDLIKALDYIQRMVEQSEVKSEIIEK